MREYTKKTENQSRSLDSNPRASKQAPISEILQTYKNGTLGRQPIQQESIEDEDLLQSKRSGQTSAGVILQRYKESIQQYVPEKDELLQGKFDAAQREKIDEDELLQGKFESFSTTEKESIQREEKPNNTGLPDNLKSGIEDLSGYSLDDIKVHYNSDKPAQLQALAYTQGTDIHVGPGQEKHLPHEAWHVVQQKQGRVQPTMQLQGVNVNDNEDLEKEADVIQNSIGKKSKTFSKKIILNDINSNIVQKKVGFEFETGYTIKNNLGEKLSKKTPIGNLRGNNWKAESDDNGRLEFIIDPPIEINENSNLKISNIFEKIEAVCYNLQEQSKKNRKYIGEDMEDEDSLDTDYEYNSFKLNLITDVQHDHAYNVFPNGSEISANPQVTMGLTLDQILKLSEVKQEGNIAMSIAAVEGGISLFLDRIPSEGAWGKTSDKLKGLLILISNYLRSGSLKVTSIPLQYPKQITDSFILSRTSFAQLYKRITHPELIYFDKNKDKFLDLVLSVSDFIGKGDGQVLERGIGKQLTKERDIGPTRKDWILGITNGEDLMSKIKNEEYESMGELGDKTEYVGTSSGILYEAGGIFEIRGGQTRSLPFENWKDYALEYAKSLQSFQKNIGHFLDDKTD